MQKPHLRHIYYYIAYLIFSVIYITISLLAPIAPNRFNLSTARTHFLQLTILLPAVLIWLTAVYGVEKLHSYAKLIKGSRDGRAFAILSLGLTFLVGSIFINSLVGLVRPWALKDEWLAAYTIFSNYLSMLLPLFAYAIMYAGSSQLLQTIKTKAPKRNWVVIILLVLIIGAGYLISLHNYDYLTSTPDPTKYSSFYMSDIMIILTLGIPYMVGWALAIKAMFNLNQYRKSVKGAIYRRSLLRLEIGTLIVILFYVAVQMLVAFSTYFSHVGLGSILAFLYILIILYGAGFLIMASGARRLSKIERVN